MNCAFCVLLASLGLSTPAQASIVVWGPAGTDTSVTFRGASECQRGVLVFTWYPCDGGPPQEQRVDEADLFAGVNGDFTVNMCKVDIAFGSMFEIRGTNEHGSYAIALDNTTLTLQPDASSMNLGYSVLSGSPSGVVTLSVQ